MNYKDSSGKEANGANQVFNRILEDVEFYKIFENVSSTETTSGKCETICASTEDEYEIYIFANFDICNFTKYKREHKSWTKLLEMYLATISDDVSGLNLSKFWKFNGDSLTYRRRIKGVSEVCEFIERVQAHLELLQDYLNKQISENRIFIKAGVWIAGFDKSKSVEFTHTNNVRISVENKDEFVGENIDEGFRLSNCSKAGKLVIDPKIVALLYLYEELLVKYEQGELDRSSYDSKSKYHSDFIRTKICKVIFHDSDTTIAGEESSREKILGILREYFNQDNPRNNICRKLYLMEYSKCKGVWDDRDYPIFWYIDSIDKCEFIYDEEVDNKKLREHSIYKDVFLHYSDDEKFKERIKSLTNTFKKQLISSIEQISVVGTIGELAECLMFIPSGESEQGIYDKANLYYMVMCIVKSRDTTLGALIFKRNKDRVHLKGVWDLLPIKHGKVFEVSKYSIVKYLGDMLEKLLHINDMPFKDSVVVKFIDDPLRRSIVPFTMCNIYRNKEVHNGILCVANIDINEIEISDFLGTLKKGILEQDRYCDVKLVRENNIDVKDDSFIVLDDSTKIRSLSIDEVKLDALSVSKNPNVNILKDRGEVGIAYLSQSIKELLGRNI